MLVSREVVIGSYLASVMTDDGVVNTVIVQIKQ